VGSARVPPPQFLALVVVVHDPTPSQRISYKRAFLTGVYLSFTSLLCAQDTGGENPCIDTQDGLKASDCGRLGREAAGHPWSALRVVKSRRKDCPAASVLPKPKQQLCIQSGTRADYLNYLPEVGEAGKRSAGNRIGYQVIDRQPGRNKADERWYPSRPCSVLNSGLRTLRR
jgi:hypothetical protein